MQYSVVFYKKIPQFDKRVDPEFYQPHFNSKFFNSETLLVLLKSIVGQLQLKKGCSGTILTAINKDEFNKLVLPKVDEAVRFQIQQKITESFNLRKQSKHLLECAKRAVEIAIEQNEDTAIKWLQTQIKEAGHGG